MTILPKIQQKIKRQILPCVPEKWHPMMILGINALSFNPFRSLNSNARLVRKDQKKAAMKQMWRLTQHKKLYYHFASLLLQMVHITKKSVLVMDFSSFGKFQILWLGKQTRSGRTIPVWFDIILYPITDPTSQNWFILDSLREFLIMVGCKPKLVCDRGFIGKTSIHGFLDLGLLFYVRMKAGKKWLVDEKARVLSKQWVLDQVGMMYGEKLRVVRSSQTLKRKLKAKECWYILTNDFEASREEIMGWYYHRFEIEELFKDVKQVLEVKPRWFEKMQTMKMVLWFEVLGIWITWEVGQLAGEVLEKLRCQGKKRLSWIKAIYEEQLAERLRLVIPVQDYRKGVIAF